jgi:DNA replication protein DnaC
MVPEDLLQCPQHGALEAPERDPFPMRGYERYFAEEQAFARIASRWRIPSRQRAATIERSDPTPALEVIRAVVRDAEDEWPTSCVILAGPTGVGKSWAATAGFRHLAVWGGLELPVYWTFDSLVRALTTPGSDEVLRQCIESDLLFVDDFGAGYLKEGGLGESLTERIIIDRESEMRATWLTTNFTEKQFRLAFGDRIADRVSGEWGCWHNILGDSLRRKHAALVAGDRV